MGTIINSDIWGFTSLNYGSNGYNASVPNFSTNVNYQNINQSVIVLNSGVSSSIAVGNALQIEDYSNHNKVTATVIDIGATASGLPVIWLSVTSAYISANNVSQNTNNIFTYTAPVVGGKVTKPAVAKESKPAVAKATKPVGKSKVTKA